MVAGFRAMFSMFGLLSVPAASTAGSPTKARGRMLLAGIGGDGGSGGPGGSGGLGEGVTLQHRLN
jgi:hypothetical protein